MNAPKNKASDARNTQIASLVLLTPVFVWWAWSASSGTSVVGLDR